MLRTVIFVNNYCYQLFLEIRILRNEKIYIYFYTDWFMNDNINNYLTYSRHLKSFYISVKIYYNEAVKIELNFPHR